MGDSSNRAMRRAATAMAAAAALALTPGPAAADLCDITVYESSFGAKGAAADTVFAKGEQFIVCFSSTQDGYVSLWDRIPSDGPVERLVPNVNYTGPGDVAVPVSAGVETCFGDGSDGYYLHMDPADGDGLGRMWLVFSSDENQHPDVASFGSSDSFRDSYHDRRFGAGSITEDPGREGRRAAVPEPTGCLERGSVDYFYAVVDQ